MKQKLPLIIAVINLIAIGTGVFFAYKGTLGAVLKESRHEHFVEEYKKFEEDLKASGPVLFSLDRVDTNLYGVPRRFVRIKVDLEMLSEVGFEEIMGLEPEVRDQIISIMNAQRFSDIDSIQGKLFLKTKIVSQVNKFLKTGVVKDVFFSDFAVQ